MPVSDLDRLGGGVTQSLKDSGSHCIRRVKDF